MKRVLKIFVHDLVGLSRNIFALIIAVGLCIIPSLYAWFNIAASWDPYGNTSSLKVAVASGTKNAGYLMDKIKDGTGDYTFIEIMGCPGGCINGGGQPIQHAVVRNFVDLKERRAKALYESDKNNAKRCSHENSAVKELYDEFLGEPGSHKAHEILHTTYVARKKYD